MSEVIKLLPDHLANQIAAGEVIQRPASAVKELLENAIDAGATEIQLILKDAGKELIQVVDNGKGMSPLDARMSFERHATSKIRQIDDLFAIKTMGFRGEALASIAAVAQVELKSKRPEDELGTHILIESSEIQLQEPIATQNGTSFAIKNLFYNVPARRKFLKSNTTEFKNIIDEFTRIVLTYPHIAFKLFHNNVEQFHLTAGNLKSRITAMLGNRVEKHLIPIQEDTDLINIYGFIGKPEIATKTRGNQFFFVNNRFIKSSYLHHAVVKAFDGLIEKDAFPFYCIYFELDPSKVDVNVHPTKQEVKFDDDQMLYAYMQSAVKHALSIHNIAPSIDFSLNADISNLDAIRLPQSSQDIAQASSGYLSSNFSRGGNAHFIEKGDGLQQWKQQKERLFDPLGFDEDNARPFVPLGMQMESSFPIPSKFQDSDEQDEHPQQQHIAFEHDHKHAQPILQWDEYIISTMKSGVLVMHKKRAMERIAYEKLALKMSAAHVASQALLFPPMIELSPSDSVLLEEIIPTLSKIGYEISPLGNHTFCVQGAPTDVPAGREQSLLEEVLETLKNESTQVQDQLQDKILKTLAKRMSSAQKLEPEEANALVDELFACEQPQYTPDGWRIFNILPKQSIDALL